MGAAGIVNQHFHGLAATATAMALLALGGALVIRGGLSLGALAAFFAAATQANAALSALIGGVPQLLSGHESIARLAELRAIGSEEAPSGTVEPDFSETLCFDHVSFGWGDRPILSDVSITVGPGSVTAIAAPNGQGKTTLIELALGLLEPDEGKICLGSPVSQLDSARYRGAIGMLPQNPMFLRGSIRENICFGREAIDADRLQRAVAMAALDTVLATLPEGIDTAMGDSGQRLSGGERQRVALARALIHAPPLLILDEPTNHLDAAAVALLIERLFADRHRPAILMTTHDPRLIAIADCVYDLADGAIRARAPVRLVAS
jgi:ABC-type multidrug transport system fused ATPase/permease subunit